MMNPSDEPDGLDVSPFRSPEGSERFLSHAESLLKQGLFQEAVALARERLALFPGDVDARIICGRALAAMGRIGSSLAIFEEVKKDVLKWVCVLEYLADIFKQKGEKERARDCYQMLSQVSNDPSRKEMLLRKIQELNGKPGEHANALIDDLSRSFKTMTMADLYIRQGHLDMARKVLKEMAKSDPGNLRAAERLREVETMIEGKVPGGKEERVKAILQELDRWLKNVERLESHD
jgi:tetratricopeptide (TPR) repeat protein